MLKKSFLIIIFEKLEDNHYTEFIFLKMLTIQHFIFINLKIL